MFLLLTPLLDFSLGLLILIVLFLMLSIISYSLPSSFFRNCLFLLVYLKRYFYKNCCQRDATVNRMGLNRTIKNY